MKTKPQLPPPMSYCLNPDCHNPRNPVGTNFCQTCGLKLLVGERYRALKLLGQGGFGKTFLAINEDQPSKPLCVIKQLLPVGILVLAQGTNGVQKAAKLFEQEAERLAQLGKHPQIPQLLAYFTQDNRQYLVQEFIEGQNLAEILNTEGAFSEKQIRDLLKSLLPVLEFIHSHKVIHRDIKPENIIRRPDQKLVLVDFGAAKLATGTALALTGTAIGSAAYAAPEQARGKAFLTSDLYSLGVTCIHLLTQVDPFDLYSDSQDAWVWRDYLNNNRVTRLLGQILDKMLERATSRRYQSATEILNDLKVQRKRTTSISPPGSTPRASAVFTAPSTPITQHWRCVKTLIGHEKPVNAVAISPDGQIIASGSADKTIKLWNLSTGEVHTLRGHRDSIRAIAFSPDGQILVSSGNDCTIKIWLLAKSSKPITLKGHYGFVTSLAISPNGQMLASADEGETSELKFWRLPYGDQIKYSGIVYDVSCVAFSLDGLWLAIAKNLEGIKLWQMPNGEEICTLKRSGSVTSLAFSPDGLLLAHTNAGTAIKIWQLSTGEEFLTLKSHSARVNSVVFSPDGQVLASGSNDETIKMWQRSTGKVICTLTEHLAAVQSVAFGSDGKTIVSGSWDKTIKVWRCK